MGELLGRGGMGSVHRAYDASLGEEVALKLLHSVTPEDRIELKAEFRALANIVHPNLVNLYELIVNQDECFFTMELVRGVNFAEYVRGASANTSSFVRLRDAAKQLALALTAVHEAGKLHRDVKPQNVLVTAAGRVVLLDFGLVSKLTQGTKSTARSGFAGTVHYMAPEQTWGGPLSEAADWYSYGVTLYEGLTGKLPIDGEPVDVAIKKRDSQPSSLRAAGFAIPEALDELLMGLLQPKPENRPGPQEIIKCFGGELPRLSVVSNLRSPQEHSTTLVGRQNALQSMLDALPTAGAGSARVFRVSGVSGIGKSSLVRAFLAEPAVRSDSLILSARCHPQETIAFNAIDGVVDELARELKVLPTQSRPELDPQHAFALTRVFPVLQSVLDVGDARTHADELTAHKIRQSASDGLRLLLARLAGQRSVVLWIDDAQWADHDSGVVLRDLLRKAVDMPLVLILSYRTEDERTSPCLQLLDEEIAASTAPTVSIELGPLDQPASRQLVERLLEEHAAASGGFEAMLDDAAGSPFFLNELARYMNRLGAGTATDERVSLEQMLQARTRDLPSTAQRVLQVFSVAGAPLQQRVALRAAGLTERDSGLIPNLERLSILRTTDAHRRISEVYHDRIRAEVLANLSTSERQNCHRAIGKALVESTSASVLAAVDHFEAAADSELMRRYILPAAHQASAVMAFDRAARLYERAIELGGADVALHDLYRKLALALAHSGRGKEAGEAFLQAAAYLRQEPTLEAEQVTYLQQKAAEQFIQTGHYEQGMRVLHEVLGELGVPFPRTRDEAVRKATALRLVSLLLPVRRWSKRRRNPTPHELRKFDALWAANIRIAMVDQAISSYATARCAADALKLGEPSRMTRALALEGANWATLPVKRFQQRAERLVGMARELSSEASTPYDEAFVLAAGAVGACFRCEFRRLVTDMDKAIAMIQASSPGTQWEASLWQMWAMIGLTHLGEMDELVKRANTVREDAEHRNDRFAAQNVNIGRPITAWLARDLPDTAIEEADRALAWAPAEYTTQHYQHYISSVEVQLYRDNPAAAWQRTLDTWPAHAKNVYSIIVFCRDELLQARARAAVALAAAGEAEALRCRTTVAELQREAETAAKAMAKHGLPMGRGWAQLVQGALFCQRGKRRDAERALQAALEAFDACEMQLYREAARYCLGKLMGPSSGSKLEDEARAWMLGQNIVQPSRMVYMLAPGFPWSTRAAVAEP